MLEVSLCKYSVNQSMFIATTNYYLAICSPSGAITTTASAVTAATAPPQPACTNGKLFETCGTACPLTCDNYRSPPFVCPAVCVMGCFCPQGLVELGNTCVLPTSCPGELLQHLCEYAIPT